jgi:hypothetical protein
MSTSGSRQRFAVTPSNGGHAIELGDNETAVLTVAEDGSLVVTVESKPAANGNNGNAVVRSARRGFRGQRSRMSWERDPASGGVTFLPDEGEVIDMSGDAIQAVVTAQPSPEMPE